MDAETAAPARFDWSACLAAWTDDDTNKLAEWRHFDPFTVRFLHQQGLIGKYNDGYALPVHNQAGGVIGAHYRRREGKWAYSSGAKWAPLIIGDLTAAKTLHTFESQWDAFAVLDAFDGSLSDDDAVIITRGAANGAAVGKLIPERADVLAWMQNDPAGEGWLLKIAENTKAAVYAVRTPLPHKDPNDWRRAGATRADLSKARASAQPYKLRPGEISKEESERLCALLDGRRFDVHNPPPEPHAILKLGESTIATAENIVMIQAKVKAGKTAALGAIIASTMNPEGDCFGFSSTNPQGHALIHFDTEQSRFHHHQVLSRALWRSGLEEPPAWLRSYYMKALPIAQLKTALRAELERAREECGGVLMAILDGIGDFCPDVNDPAISTELVSWIEALAMEYQTSFVLVLHENPGTDAGKTRGHLGSHLERKAETNLRLEKDSDGVTVIFSDRSRTAHIPKEKGPRFAWDDAAKMHLSVAALADAKVNRKTERLQDLGVQIFKDTPNGTELTWEELHTRIEGIEGVGRSGARKKFDQLRDASVIRKFGEKYRLL